MPGSVDRTIKLWDAQTGQELLTLGGPNQAMNPVDLLLGAGVPAGPIQDYGQVLTEDPHVKARGMIAELDHPVEGRIPVLASPLRLTATPPSIRRPPPLLGEHTDEVLGRVGVES